VVGQFGFWRDVLKHKVPRSYLQALPIHARTGLEWEPENAWLVYGSRDDEFLVGW